MLDTGINYLIINNPKTYNDPETKVIEIFNELKEKGKSKDNIINKEYKAGNISDIMIIKRDTDEYFNKVIISFITPQYDDFDLIKYIVNKYKIEAIYDFYEELTGTCFRSYINPLNQEITFNLDTEIVSELSENKENTDEDISDKAISYLEERIENKIDKDSNLNKFISLIETLEFDNKELFLDVLKDIHSYSEFIIGEKMFLRLADDRNIETKLGDYMVIFQEKYGITIRDFFDIIEDKIKKNYSELEYLISLEYNIRTDGIYLIINTYVLLFLQGSTNITFTNKF